MNHLAAKGDKYFTQELVEDPQMNASVALCLLDVNKKYMKVMRAGQCQEATER